MKNRGVFRTLSNIHDEAFLQKQLMVKSRYLILQKNPSQMFVFGHVFFDRIRFTCCKKQSTPNFLKNRKFIYQVVRNFRFSENLACLVSCKTSFEIPLFALLPASFHSTSTQILFPEQGRKDWPFFSFLISLSLRK